MVGFGLVWPSHLLDFHEEVPEVPLLVAEALDGGEGQAARVARVGDGVGHGVLFSRKVQLFFWGINCLKISLPCSGGT